MAGGSEHGLEPFFSPKFPFAALGFGDSIRVGDEDVIGPKLKCPDGNRESAAMPIGMPTDFSQNNLEDPFDVRTTIGGLWTAFTYFNTRVAGSYSA